MNGALVGLDVLDISESVAGQYCGRLMADLGARVQLLEPEAGTLTRRMPPFDADGRALAFDHLNQNKQLLREKMVCRDELAGQADVIVCGKGEDAEALRALSPRLIVVKVTSFGEDGPLKDWSGPEIVLQALSGMMNSNGVAGREPLYGVGNRASYAAGVAAFIGAMAALLARNSAGTGDTVRIDAAETAAAMCFPYVMQHAYNGTDRRRGNQDIPAGQVLCSGSWVCIWVYSNRFASLCNTLGLEACLEDPRFAAPQDRAQHWEEFFALVQEKVVDRDPEQLVAELQGLQIISARAYRPSELFDSPHLAARGYWRTAEIEGRPRRVLGAPFRMSGSAAAAEPVLRAGEAR